MAGEAPPALRLQGIRHHYGPRAILLDVDLLLGAGEAVALLGSNGAGKSTLLRIAATVLRPGAGTVEVAGLDAAAQPAAARARLGFLPQEAPAYPELTPVEHVRWWSQLHGRHGDAATLLAEAGLSAVANRPAGTLSRGQRQRLGLTLATLADPPLLLLDEPSASLDAEGRAGLGRLLAARHGRRATLLVLQDEAEARRLADRLVRLRGCRLEAVP